MPKKIEDGYELNIRSLEKLIIKNYKIGKTLRKKHKFEKRLEEIKKQNETLHMSLEEYSTLDANKKIEGLQKVIRTKNEENLKLNQELLENSSTLEKFKRKSISQKTLKKQEKRHNESIEKKDQEIEKYKQDGSEMQKTIEQQTQTIMKLQKFNSYLLVGGLSIVALSIALPLLYQYCLNIQKQ